MKVFRELIGSIYRTGLSLKAQREIDRLCRASDAVSVLLGHALKETMQNDVSQEEKEWIDRIETLREKLSASTDELSIADYGAGTPSLNLTDEEMYSGRVVTRTVGEVCRSASKPYLWSLLLFKLIRKFRPRFCVELGTCLGVSASFQAAALKLNGMGRIVTLEGALSLASRAEEHLQTLGLDNVGIVTGRFQDTLGKVLYTYGAVDYAFIDGHHDEKATLAYFSQITGFLSERAVLVFDDISWSEGMKRAWKTISADDRVKISVELQEVGICIIDRGIDGKKNVTIPIV